jgi:mannosyltransferase
MDGQQGTASQRALQMTLPGGATWRTRLRRYAQTRTHPELWLLALITVIAALLRFIGLGSQSFWLDEYLTWTYTYRPPDELLSTLVNVELHPPLYHVSAWVWAKFFGHGEEGIRSLSALAGTATVPLVYAAAVLRFPRRAGLLAALLVAVNPYLVWFSQEARPYALLVALCTLSLVCFLRALDSAARGWIWAWAVVAALALTTHFYAIFFIVVEALWLLRARRGPDLWRPLALVCMVELLMLALLVAGPTSAAGWIRQWSPLSYRLELLPIQFLTGLHTLDLPFDAAVRFWVSAALCVGGLIVAFAFRRERAAAWPFLLIAAAAILLPVAVAIVKPSSDYFVPRYVIAAVVPLVILVAAGLSARRATVGAVVGVALAGIFVSMTLSIAKRPEFQRPDWRSLGRVIGVAPGRRAVITRSWVLSQPLMMYVPRLSLVYTKPDRFFATRERAQRPLTITEIVFVGPPVTAGSSPRGRAPTPDFRLVRQQNFLGYVIATYSSPKPVRSDAVALIRGVERIHGKPYGMWDRPAVYLQEMESPRAHRAP